MFFSCSRNLFLLVFLSAHSHLALAEEQSDVPTPVVTNVSTTVPNVNLQTSPQSLPEEGIQRLFSLYMDARNTGMIDEAEIMGLLCRDELGLPQYLFGFARPELPGNREVLEMGGKEAGIIGSDDEVHGRRNHPASIDTEPMNGGNRRL